MNEKKNNRDEDTSVSSPVVELDIDEFDTSGFVNSLGISRLITIDYKGDIKYHIPENASEKSFNDLQRIVKVIRTIFGDIDPWVILRTNLKILLLMRLDSDDKKYYAIAEIYNDKLTDVIDIFVKSIKDVILSKIEE